MATMTSPGTSTARVNKTIGKWTAVDGPLTGLELGSDIMTVDDVNAKAEQYMDAFDALREAIENDPPVADLHELREKWALMAFNKSYAAIGLTADIATVKRLVQREIADRRTQWEQEQMNPSTGDVPEDPAPADPEPAPEPEPETGTDTGT